MSLASNTGITVIDVMRELGVEITNDLAWSVGNEVRERWRERFGSLPEKSLRPKTKANGSHCFAIYPGEWKPIIAQIIGRYQADRDRQLDLFR